ncbi:MAG TPA: hypothetical protein VMB20_02235 [Candidatus Acidoferrum sp.]|nr:hypothetical protein [Candidatus Acidoferrum sp.]
MLIALGLLVLGVWGTHTTMRRYVLSVASPGAQAALRRAYDNWQFPIYFCFFVASALIYIAPQYWVPIAATVGFASQAIMGAIAHGYEAAWFGGRPAMQHVRNSAISYLIVMGLGLYIAVSKYNQGRLPANQVSPSMVILAVLVVIAIGAAYLRTPSK